jgi:hypothetical protein
MGGRSSSFKSRKSSGSTRKRLSNDELADKLAHEGFARWNKHGKDRMYYDPFAVGDVKRRYKGNGRLDGGTDRDGNDLWPSDIRDYDRRRSLIQSYYDLNSRKVVSGDEEFSKWITSHVNEVMKGK